MIMSIASTVERREAGSGVLATLGAAIRHLCAVYITWRLESAIILLQSMSDEELSDIGLSRPDITSAVEGHRGTHARCDLRGSTRQATK
jgi:uncharacterized protein YjiS (DUF1127 family)